MSDRDLELIGRQEQELQFDRFDAATAWTIGSRLRALAESRGQAVAIDIEMSGHLLFVCAMPGTTPENHDWVRRKKNTANLFRRSSYGVALEMRSKAQTLQERQGLPARDYVLGGGCFPIRLRGSGVVGTITISGLPERSDHALAVEVLCEHLGVPYESLALAPPAR